MCRCRARRRRWRSLPPSPSPVPQSARSIEGRCDGGAQAGHDYASLDRGGRPRCRRARRFHVRSIPTGPAAITLYPAPYQCVVNDQHDDGADRSDHHAVDVESGHADHAERVEKPPTHEGTHHSENDIEKNTLTRPIHQLTRDESRYEPENDPSYE